MRIPLSDPEQKSVREFSFASDPSEKALLFTIDSKSQNLYQRTLLSLPIGATVEIFKNKSHIAWPLQEQDVVFIAGGIGITPFRSLCRNIAHDKLPVSVTLIHVSREHFLYRNELSSFANIYLRIHRNEVIDTVATITKQNPEARYYIAGSPTFVEDMQNMLITQGIQKIETDAFKGYMEDVVAGA